MQPAPNSQITQDMGFFISFFFKSHDLDPGLLKRSMQGVLAEVPHVAGRGRVVGSGSRLIDSVLECNNEGVEFTTASASNVR